MCSPTCGWLKVDGEKALVLWQPAQLVLKPAWVDGAEWQAAQADARPRKTPDEWQDVHASDRCAPESGNRVWLKVAGTQPAGT